MAELKFYGICLNRACRNSHSLFFLQMRRKNVNQLLEQKIITQAQYDRLYPSTGLPPSSKDFDITLIVCLLRKLPSLGLNQNYKWDSPPQASDNTVEADIHRLKDFINDIAHSLSTPGYTQATFSAKWNEIEQLVLRLNSAMPIPLPNLCQTIDSYKYSPIDPAAERRIRTTMDQWIEMERGLAYNNMKSNLQHDLILFYRRHHKNIPLSPLFEDDQALLKFYELPVIQSVKIERSREGDTKWKTQIRRLRDVFYKENKLCRNIYLTAHAGYGKTAFCKRLALAWCQAKEPNESEEKYFSKHDITAVGGFSFVFVVLLRDSSGECDIDELIFNQILAQLRHKQTYNEECLATILREESCLVILDGLDEWTHPLKSCQHGESSIPHQAMRENVAVLSTTRPWKLGVIDQGSSQIDQTLELEGLSKDSAKKLKRSVISHLHGEQEKKKLDEYENEFNISIQDSHKSDLTAIPLFLMYFLFLWYSKFKNVVKTSADLYSTFIELLLSRTVKKETKAETVQGNIPPCFDNNTLCKQFYPLLKALGKLAFHTLFSETKENTLVFDSCVAEEYLSKEDLTFCLKAGIITQSKVQEVSLLEHKTKVSFAHKTMQEFLAALYINSDRDKKILYEILSKCKCVKDVLDMTKLFMFIVSISANISFSPELLQIVNEDEITQEYRSSFQSGHSHPLKDLQDMYISCCKEIPRGNEANLCLQDVIINKSCSHEEYREHLKQLITRNKRNIRSLYFYMDDMKLYTPYKTTREVIDYFALDDLENLEKILYRKGRYSDDTILPLLNSSVRVLSIYCDKRPPSSWSRRLFDKVTGLLQMEAIEIGNFTMSHSELSLLLDFISRRDCLKEINLDDLCCIGHWSSCTGLSIDLARHISLSTLSLFWLDVSEVIINMTSLVNCELHLMNQDLVLKFLNSTDNKLKTFYCERLKSSAAIDEMLRTLLEARHIREVELQAVDLDRRRLFLTSDFVNIEYLGLDQVTMEESTLSEVVDTVLELKQTVIVEINDCTISPREKFETYKGKIKTSQRVRVLKDWGECNLFVFETVKNDD